MKEELGLIDGIHVGMRDVGQPCCYFQVTTLHGVSLQIVSIDDMLKMIVDANAYKLEDLNGKPCVVETDGSLVKFKRMKL